MTGFKTAIPVATEQSFSSEFSDFEDEDVLICSNDDEDDDNDDDEDDEWKSADPAECEEFTEEWESADPAECIVVLPDSKKKSDWDLDYLFFELGGMMLDALDGFFSEL